jgi:hypothetical protein
MGAIPPAAPDDIFEKNARVMLTWHLAPDIRKGFDLFNQGTPR